MLFRSSATRMQVENVWVAGKQLLENTQFTNLNPDEFLEALKPWQKMIEPIANKRSEKMTNEN